MDWVSKDIIIWYFDNEVGLFGLVEDNWLIVSVWDKILLFDLVFGVSDVFVEIEVDKLFMWFNDGKVGFDGVFWVGIMDIWFLCELVVGFYCVDGLGEVVEICDELLCFNGFVWVFEGDYMYYFDMFLGWIECYVFDLKIGLFGFKMLFV